MSNVLLALLLLSSVVPFEARTLDGRTVTGSLTALSANHVGIATDKGRVSLDAQTVLTISQKRDHGFSQRAGGILVELVDGSLIRAEQYTVRGGQAHLTLTGGKTIEATTSAIRTVQFQPSSDLSAEWSRLLETKANSDLLIVHAEGTLDAHKGVLHDVTEDTVRFDFDGELLPVRRTKVFGLAYHHRAAAQFPPATCQITDASGSQWAARSLTLNGTLQWLTPVGVSISQPLEQVSEIDFSRGKLVYLTDLKPQSTVWTPFFAAGEPPPALKQFYAPRFDRGFDGSGLELGGVHYAKGLAIHAHTELVYRLPAGYRRFQATAGIDDATRPAGKVRLVVRGDDKVLWEGDITGSESPKPIDIAVAGYRRLTVQVDFAGAAATGARVLLCNARVVR